MNPGSTMPYLMCDTVIDPKAENRRNPNVNVPIPELSTIGVQYFSTDDENWAEQLEVFSRANKMQEKDAVQVSVEGMGAEKYEQNLKEFFTEHLHDDHEVRFIKEGSGYFDFRNKDDEWIRIHVQKGDLLFLPAGIYHRFTTDHNECAHAIRVFRNNVVWDAVNRSPEADELEIRKNFLRDYALQTPKTDAAQ